MYLLRGLDLFIYVSAYLYIYIKVIYAYSLLRSGPKMTEADSEKRPYYTWVMSFPLYFLSLAKDADKNGNAAWTMYFLLVVLSSPSLTPSFKCQYRLCFRMTHPIKEWSSLNPQVFHQILFQLTWQLLQPSCELFLSLSGPRLPHLQTGGNGST